MLAFNGHTKSMETPTQNDSGEILSASRVSKISPIEDIG